MKTKKRLLSLLLTLCLVAGLTPTSAFAAEAGTGKAIQLGTSGISGWDGAGYDYIYFGNWEARNEYTTTGPIKWRVLDDRTNTGDDGLFLLSDVLLGEGRDGYIGGVHFDSKEFFSNAWQGSDAQGWCNDFYSSSLTAQEQGAVLATTKSDETFTSDGVFGEVPFSASTNILNGDKVFFLSAEEAENGDYGFTDDAARVAAYGNNPYVWWLRSPYAGDPDFVGAISDFGSAIYSLANTSWTARPAFNLDPDSVLFASAAEGGKVSGVVGADSLQPVSDYSGSAWKLTLLDESRSFSADVDGLASVTAQAGDSVQISYSGAQAGDNEYVSVLLCDSDGKVLYYGTIAQGSESGTADVAIPSGLAAGSYTLKVFSEQCNGDYQTDYASSFEEIELEVTDASQTPTDPVEPDEPNDTVKPDDTVKPADTTKPLETAKPNDATKPASAAKPSGKTNGTLPQTGDNSNAVLWGVVALAGGMIMAGMGVHLRKRKSDQG